MVLQRGFVPVVMPEMHHMPSWIHGPRISSVPDLLKLMQPTCGQWKVKQNPNCSQLSRSNSEEAKPMNKSPANEPQQRTRSFSVSEEPWQTTIKVPGFKSSDFLIFQYGRTLVIKGFRWEGDEESGLFKMEYRRNFKIPQEVIMPTLKVEPKDGEIVVSAHKLVIQTLNEGNKSSTVNCKARTEMPTTQKESTVGKSPCEEQTATEGMENVVQVEDRKIEECLQGSQKDEKDPVDKDKDAGYETDTPDQASTAKDGDGTRSEEEESIHENSPQGNDCKCPEGQEMKVEISGTGDEATELADLVSTNQGVIDQAESNDGDRESEGSETEEEMGQGQTGKEPENNTMEEMDAPQKSEETKVKDKEDCIAATATDHHENEMKTHEVPRMPKPEKDVQAQPAEEQTQSAEKKTNTLAEPITWSVPLHGFNAEDIKVRLVEDEIVVLAEHKEDKDGATFVRRMERSFPLLENADPDTLTSRFTDDGKLTIEAMPLPESRKAMPPPESPTVFSPSALGLDDTPPFVDPNWITLPIMFL